MKYLFLLLCRWVYCPSWRWYVAWPLCTIWSNDIISKMMWSEQNQVLLSFYIQQSNQINSNSLFEWRSINIRRNKSATLLPQCSTPLILRHQSWTQYRPGWSYLTLSHCGSWMKAHKTFDPVCKRGCPATLTSSATTQHSSMTEEEVHL